MESLSTSRKRLLALIAATGLVVLLVLVLAVEAIASAGFLSSPIGSTPGTTVQRVQALPVGARKAVVSVSLAPRPAQANGDAFWRALDNCESPNGDTHPLYVGDFQFHPDTAARAGGTDLAAAKRWAAMVVADGGHPGSTAGWPVCWWRAKRAAGYAPY